MQALQQILLRLFVQAELLVAFCQDIIEFRIGTQPDCPATPDDGIRILSALQKTPGPFMQEFYLMRKMWVDIIGKTKSTVF